MLIDRGEIKIIIIGLIGLLLYMIIPMKPVNIDKMRAEIIGRDLVCKDK